MIDQANFQKSASDIDCYWDKSCLHVFSKSANLGRKVLFLSDHSGPKTMESWFISRFGGHGMWGCIELARRGYEVLLPANPSWASRRWTKLAFSDFNAAFTTIRTLGKNDIVYAVHNMLRWSPLLANVGMIKAKLVTYVFAKDPLPFASMQDGLISMTRSGFERLKQLKFRALIAHIPWGIELTEHHHCYRRYQPEHGLSTGVTNRDLDVIRRAFSDHQLSLPLKLCARGRDFDEMPESVQVVKQMLSPEELVSKFYGRAAYALITLPADSEHREALGCTVLLEAMALGRPVIKTRAGAVDSDIDVEKLGIGLFVPPGDSEALANAIKQLEDEPDLAKNMGLAGRKLAESYYNIERFSNDLHEFFQRLG